MVKKLNEKLLYSHMLALNVSLNDNGNTLLSDDK